MKYKLEIVTGFLGSGKTTFINSYIKTDICRNERLLIILLEMGNKKVDSSVKSIYLKEIDELKDIIIKNNKNNVYNRIIIEVNGTMPLIKIGNLLRDKNIKKKINFYGNYFLGNCENLDVYIRNMGELIIPFLQSSKLILLNNINKIDKERKKTLIKTVENINLTAPILLIDSIERLDEDLQLNKYFKHAFIDKLFNKYIKKGVSNAN